MYRHTQLALKDFKLILGIRLLEVILGYTRPYLSASCGPLPSSCFLP